MLVDDTTFGLALQIIKRAIGDGSDVVVDCETTGLEPWRGDRQCGIAIDVQTRPFSHMPSSAPAHSQFYFPFRHEVGFNLPISYIQSLVPLLSRPDVTYVGANYSFDMKMLYMDGVPLPATIQDALLAAQLMNENEDSHALKALCNKYVDANASREEQELADLMISRGLKPKRDIWKMPAALVEPYACKDVVLTRRLRDFYIEHLQRWALQDLWRESNEYSLVLTRIECRGLLLDVPRIHRQMEEANRRAAAIQAEIDVLVGHPINLASSPQVQRFFDMRSVTKEHLEMLSDASPDPIKKQVATLMQEYRTASKAEGSYYRPYLHFMDPNEIIHPNLDQRGTYTSRLACSDPNLQAVPADTERHPVKYVFKPRDGYYFAEFDYEQAEMRVACHFAQEANMAALLKSGADTHQVTADRFGMPRPVAKRINFGVIYGLGASGLAKRLAISISDAKAYLASYHQGYPGFRKLYRHMEHLAETKGYFRFYTGRVRHFNGPKAEPHKAMSNLIQGTVAEIVRVAMTRLDHELREQYGMHMLLPVHDSLIFEVPNSIPVEQAVRLVRGIMEDTPFDPPMKVSAKVGPTWGDVRKWEEANVAA